MIDPLIGKYVQWFCVEAEPRHALAADLEARHAVRDALLGVGEQRGERGPQALEGRLLRLGHGREVVVHVLVRHVAHPFLFSCPSSMPVAADGPGCSAGVMVADLVSPAKARPGDRVAVLSPSFAAPGVAPAVHEQAMHGCRRSPVSSRWSTRPPGSSGPTPERAPTT